jgi:hypothetical protein
MHSRAVFQYATLCSNNHTSPLTIMPIESTNTPSLTPRSRGNVAFQPSLVETPTRQDSSPGEIVGKDSHAEQTTKSDRQGEGIGKENPRIWPPAQRVYKEPRQKVRWRCEICRTVFTTSKICRTCEHEMCKGCDRDP